VPAFGRTEYLMSQTRWCVIAAGLLVLGACQSAEPVAMSPTNPATMQPGSQLRTSPASPTTPTSTLTGSQAGAGGLRGPVAGTSPTTTTSPASDSDAGPGAPSPADPNPGTTATPAGCDYMTSVALASDLVIPAGKTVRVCPGVTFTAAMGVKIDVLGELVVEGTAASPVSFVGSGQPRSWYGIAIESGGNLKLSQAKIGGASYGIYALPGSSFTVDYAEIGTSFKAAIVQSNGSFNHTRFEATTPNSISLADQVSVDDPNGTLTIMDASPTITNCNFDGSSGFTDMVRIGGKSSPTFDHVYLHGAHCGFHTFGGTNTSAHITNAIFENLAYGVMAYTTKPIIENSVFKTNSTDVGFCTGATKDNTPELKNNSYTNGMPVIDASCFQIGTTDPSPATTANPSAGPSGL
jgi:hypothetical protein